VAKAVVAGVLIWGCTILVSLAALVGWIVLFGAHPVVFPGVARLAGGFRLDGGALLLRDAIATAYVAFGFTALLALGTLFSHSRTPPPAPSAPPCGCTSSRR
jgi:hypothetical protein